MNNNKSINSNIELILDKINGQYVLVNKKDIESAIEFRNKMNDQILANDENATSELNVEESTNDSENFDNFAKFAKVLEISRDSLMGNSWINPVEFVAIVDENSNEKLSNYISNIEVKTNKLYEDLTSIVVNKYKISEQNKVDEIKKMYEEHDKELDDYLNLVDDVIYNVEVDWHDYLLMDCHLNLFNSYTIEKKVNEFSHEVEFEDVIDSIDDNDEIIEDDGIEKVSPIVIDFESFNKSNLSISDILDENSEEINSRQLHSELESKNNDELNEYINDVVSKVNVVQNNIEEKISLYRTLSTQKFTEENNVNILVTLDRLAYNSKTAESIMSKIMNSEDSSEIKDLLLERNEIYSTNVKIMKKISKHVDLDESLNTLNDEIIALKVALDNLSSKLSVAYNIAYKNYAKYSKSIDKQNAKLAKAEQKRMAKEQKRRMKELRKAYKKSHSSSSLSLEDQKIMDQIIVNYQNRPNSVYNLANGADLFADKFQMKKFRAKLSNRISELAKIGRKTNNSVDGKENLFNKYFIFMNAELGIISELSELAGLLELKRVKLISEIAENEIVYYKSANLEEKILFTTRANYSFLKILCAEILVLRTILLHREYLASIKNIARSQCHELASYIEWDHRLYWWNISTVDAINIAYNNSLYSHDEGIKYLYEQISKYESEFGEDVEYSSPCCCCCDDCSCESDCVCDPNCTCSCENCKCTSTSSDQIPMPKVMVMKFERIIGQEKAIHKETVKNIIQKQDVIVESKKSDELVSETKKNKKLRKLDNRGMSRAGLRIQEIIDETKDEVKEFNKEKK